MKNCEQVNGEINIYGTYFVGVTEGEQTPTLLISKNRIEDNCKRLKTVVSRVNDHKTIVCFALKAAPNERMLTLISKNGFGAEVYCEQELDMALKLGISPIVVDGLYKPSSFLTKAIKNNVLLINADSFEELKIINQISFRLNKVQEVGLRIKQMHETKMGISLESLEKSISFLKSLKNVTIVGVHTHPGSNIKDIENASKYYKNLKLAVGILARDFRLKYIDIGGGFSERVEIDHKLEQQIESIIGYFETNLDVTFIVEPGRFLVSDAGVLLTQFHQIRESDRIAILNITIAPFLYTTGSTFRYLFPNHFTEKKVSHEDWVIGGIWPTDKDIIPKEKLYNGVPSYLNEGDYFCILNAGAYTFDRLNEYSFQKVAIKYI